MDDILFEAEVSGENGHYAELSLPATDYALLYVLERLNLPSDARPTCEILRYEKCQFLSPLVSDELDLYEFNALARKLSELDFVDEVSFEGLVRMETDKKEGIITLPKLIDLAYSTQCCNAEPACDDEELGKFYTENDLIPELKDISDEVYELLELIAGPSLGS